MEGLAGGGGGGDGGGRKDVREMDKRGLIYEHPAKIRMTIVRSRTEKASSDDGCEQDAKQETNLFPHDRPTKVSCFCSISFWLDDLDFVQI